MISGRKIVATLLLLLFGAVIGMALVFLKIHFGKYIVYITVVPGAILTIVTTIAAQLGMVDKDL